MNLLLEFDEEKMNFQIIKTVQECTFINSSCPDNNKNEKEKNCEIFLLHKHPLTSFMNNNANE